MGDFQRIMQDASDVERKLNDNERFKKRRMQLVHRVNMFTDDPDSDNEADDSVQQLRTTEAVAEASLVNILRAILRLLSLITVRFALAPPTVISLPFPGAI